MLCLVAAAHISLTLCSLSLSLSLSVTLTGPAALFVDPDLLPDFEGCQLLPPSAVAGAAAVVLGEPSSSCSHAQACMPHARRARSAGTAAGCRSAADSSRARVLLHVLPGDMGPGWSYSSLNSAFRLMMAQPAPLLISLGKSRCVRRGRPRVRASRALHDGSMHDMLAHLHRRAAQDARV